MVAIFPSFWPMESSIIIVFSFETGLGGSETIWIGYDDRYKEGESNFEWIDGSLVNI